MSMQNTASAFTQGRVARENSRSLLFRVSISVKKKKKKNQRVQRGTQLTASLGFFTEVENSYYQPMGTDNELNSVPLISMKTSLRSWQTRTHCCGHIVAHDVSWAAQTGKHLLRAQNVSEQNQKHFCIPDTKFVSTTNVASAGKLGNICVGNNVSATMCPRSARAFSERFVKACRLPVLACLYSV